MQQRDLIKDQIEQLGKVLGQIMAAFFRLKTEGQTQEAIQITNNEFLDKLDISIETLVELNGDELTEQLLSKNLVDTHLDELASYLYEVGIIEQNQGKNPKKWLKAAEKVIKLADKQSNTITLERMDLKLKIEKALQ